MREGGEHLDVLKSRRSERAKTSYTFNYTHNMSQTIILML